jgi:hypothetical protein
MVAPVARPETVRLPAMLPMAVTPVPAVTGPTAVLAVTV